MADSRILAPFIRYWEGGFANVPGDRGGATKWGVTIGTFRNVFGKDKTVYDLKQMTEEQWHLAYKKHFWDKWRADEIENQSVANLLVDWVWTSGSYGIRIPQALLGVKVDGIVGPKTIAAVNGFKQGQDALFRGLWGDRKAYFERIAKRPGQGKFLKGWMNRLNAIKYGRLVYNGRTVWV